MISIRTLNLQIKNLEYKKEYDFDSYEDFFETYKNENFLNHIFLIHPLSLDDIDKIFNLLNNKNGYFFIILLSTDFTSLIDFKKDNIWCITKSIPNNTNDELKKKFCNFYKNISLLENASNIEEIKNLIVKYLDENYQMDLQIEKDIAFIHTWMSMSKDNKDWTLLPRFQNNKEIIKIKYFLEKIK